MHQHYNYSRYSSVFILLLMCGILLGVDASGGQAQWSDGYIRSQRLGIAHISSVSHETTETRYRQALALGAGWNRWPIYWHWAEIAEGEWDWRGYDRQVINDSRYGFSINAILMGIPTFYQDGDIMQGIYEPIFADGSDTPAPDKAFNPENPWVEFVYKAVNRYKPGGALAQAGELPVGAGIRVWEIWNEPDLRQFWRGSVRDYARLLKVSYIVIKQADPRAQVMFGGLLYPTENNWLAQVLSLYTDDPDAVRFNQYMDIIGIHNYINPWRSGWLALYVRDTMRYYGIDRPIWLNETGVPVWDDYPGPIWEATSPNRTTSRQQAWFFIQSAVYAWSEGVDKVFYHQLYDDCGDQPAGTNFALHMGELCIGDALCAGDAHGMYRNLSDSVCFSNHPHPGTPRPITQAYRLVAQVFGTQPFDHADDLDLAPGVVAFAFERPRTAERIVVLWNRRFDRATVEIPAVGRNAQLISLEGNTVIQPNGDNAYELVVPPAMPDNYGRPPQGADAAIGGPPYILIEREGSAVDVVQIPVETIEIPPTQVPIVPTAMPQIRPTANPANDTSPPMAQVMPLPETSEAVFMVMWEGQDDSAIDRYLVWVRVDGGEWSPWLETSLTGANYIGVPGSTYEFVVWAVDIAGNWSTNTDLIPQAQTVIP